MVKGRSMSALLRRHGLLGRGDKRGVTDDVAGDGKTVYVAIGLASAW
jgi:hypothetical protein